MTAQALKLF